MTVEGKTFTSNFLFVLLLFKILEGEADWKMIAIAITDPWAAILNDVTDLEAKLPGKIIIYAKCDMHMM